MPGVAVVALLLIASASHVDGLQAAPGCIQIYLDETALRGHDLLTFVATHPVQQWPVGIAMAVSSIQTDATSLVACVV